MKSFAAIENVPLGVVRDTYTRAGETDLRPWLLVAASVVLLADLALHTDSDVPRAHDLADEALAILPADELAGLYDAHSLITTIFWWLGNADGATRHGEAMLDLAHRAERPELESLALTQLAGVAGVRGDAAGSLALLERAETLAEASGSREAMAYALAVHGRGFGADEADEAERYLLRALEMLQEIGAAGRYGWTLAHLAAIYRQRGDLARAEKTYRDAVRRLRGTHEQGFLVEAERGLAELLVERDKVDEADPKLHRRCFIVRDANWHALAYGGSEVRCARYPWNLVAADAATRFLS